MLIQQTPISALDPAAQARLRAAAHGLLQTNEAALGYVLFEGRYFSVAAVKQLIGDNRQFLREIM